MQVWRFLPQYGCVYHGLVSHPKVKKNCVLTGDMIEVVVNLNIIVNHVVLLIISIYISNQHRRISGVAFHLDVLHHLTILAKNVACVVLAGCVVGNTPFQFIPALKSIVHTI